jgi:putative hydrolase of HD superfamily
MEIQKYLEILSLTENLKNNTRHSWTSAGRHESVAEHSWRLTLMAYLVKDEFPEVDIQKVMLMCLCHDLGEAITGDIPSFLKTDTDEAVERDVVSGFVQKLPEPYCAELTALFAEMDALETPEARLYKALDKLEAIQQHNEADIGTWLPLEYDLQLTYGAEQTAYSPYLQALRAAINENTKEKIRGANRNDLRSPN